MDQQNIQEEEIKIDLLRQYLPYWPLFVLLVLMSLGGAYLYLRYTNPIYQVNAKILVKDEKKGLAGAEVLETLNLFGEKKIVENETDILRSWPLIEEVVKELKIYTSQWKKGNVRDVEVFGYDAPFVITALNPDSIHSTEKIPFSYDLKNNSFSVNHLTIPFGSIIVIKGQKFRVEKNSVYNHDQSNGIVDVQFLNVSNLAMGIQRGLNISPTSKQSSMINVSYQTTVPAKGRQILNKLFEVYENASLTDKNQVAQNTLRFVDERLGLVTQQLDSVEQNIKDYKTDKGIVNISAQGELFLESMKESDSRLTEVNIQLGILKDIENYVQGKGPNPGTVPSMIGINDPTLGQLLEKLYSTELEYKRLASITGEKNDQLVMLREQIGQLKPNILENISSIRRNLSVSRSRMSGNVSQTNALLRNIPEQEKALIEISRQQAIKNSIYTFLLEKREEAALSYASAVADSRVIESARSTTNPIKPVPMMIYGIALMVGVVLAVVYVAIKEQFNNRILFAKELELQTRVPIIGEVSHNARQEDFVIAEGKRTEVAEQIRAIRGNLSYFGLNGIDKKVLLVTSSVPGEGKSFISTNLAISLTLTGKKVALLELDLRKPKVSKMFNIKREKGISNYLSGASTFDDIIQTSAFKNLFIIPSGPVPPNPTELILLPAFGNLMRELKNNFDIIIIDTPPIGLVSDAQILAVHSDASIYVARHNHTPKSYMALIRSLYEGNKYPNMSLVFNGVKKRGMRYSSGYGYGYGNGYGSSYSQGTGYYLDDEKGKIKKNIFQRISSFLS